QCPCSEALAADLSQPAVSRCATVRGLAPRVREVHVAPFRFRDSNRRGESRAGRGYRPAWMFGHLHSGPTLVLLPRSCIALPQKPQGLRLLSSTFHDSWISPFACCRSACRRIRPRAGGPPLRLLQRWGATL